MFFVSGENDKPLSSVPLSQGILNVENGPYNIGSVVLRVVTIGYNILDEFHGRTEVILSGEPSGYETFRLMDLLRTLCSSSYHYNVFFPEFFFNYQKI